MPIRACFFALTLFLTGCLSSNYWSQNYTPAASQDVYEIGFAPHSTVELVASDDPHGQAQGLLSNGYSIIGESSFNGPVAATKAELLRFAKKVGADLVFYKIEFDKTQRGTEPLQTYVPGEPCKTTIKGKFGGEPYHITKPARKPGELRTECLAVDVRHYTYHAVFVKKHLRPILGVISQNLSAQECIDLKRDKGAMVVAVIKNSPADISGVLPGDLIVGLDGCRVSSAQRLQQLLGAMAGRSAQLHLIREGEPIELKVFLNKAMVTRK